MDRTPEGLFLKTDVTYVFKSELSFQFIDQKLTSEGKVVNCGVSSALSPLTRAPGGPTPHAVSAVALSAAATSYNNTL